MDVIYREINIHRRIVHDNIVRFIHIQKLKTHFIWYKLKFL